MKPKTKTKDEVSKLMTSLGFKPRTGEVVQCLFCKSYSYKSPSRIKQYKKRFCSTDHLMEYLKKNAFKFSCYVCGKDKETQPYQMKIRKRPTCSRKCRSVLQRQDAEERRKKGYTKHQIDRLERYSPEAENWRKAVFDRDDYTCQICFRRGGYLEADHIKPWAYFRELRFEITNGRTLCRRCHDKTKIGAKKMKEIYGEKK